MYISIIKSIYDRKFKQTCTSKYMLYMVIQDIYIHRYYNVKSMWMAQQDASDFVHHSSLQVTLS